MKELELLSNPIASNRNYSAIVPRNVISTSVRANRVNRIVTPLTNVSKLPSLLPSLLPEAAIQGVVRVIIDKDSIEIYHNRVNETFPPKIVIIDDQAIADELEFIKNNVEYMKNINEIVDIATTIFSSSPINQSIVLDYMVQAFINDNKNYELDAAIKWSDKFVFPLEVHTKYAKRFE